MKLKQTGRMTGMLLVVMFSSAVAAQGGPGGWMGHGMMGGQGPWGPGMMIPGAAPQIPDAMLDAMAERMVRMHALIQKLTATDDVEARRQLMREHLSTVHPMMGPGLMMRPGMMGPGAMGMPGMMGGWGMHGRGYAGRYQQHHAQEEASWHRNMEERLDRIEALLKSR